MADYIVGQVSSSISKAVCSSSAKNSKLSNLFSVGSASKSTVLSNFPIRSTPERKSKKTNEIDNSYSKKQNKADVKRPTYIREKAFNQNRRKRNWNLQDSDDFEDDVPKKKKPSPHDPEEDVRTVFIGNLPHTCEKKELIKLFKKYGKIESVRFRSAAPADPLIPKKLVVIKHDFHSKRTNINAYIKFHSSANAINALEMNGYIFKSHHIRVDLETNKNEHDHHRSIFIGNLSFEIEEENVWQHFKDCGPIEGVRLIRDIHSGMGKGFGYVLFKDSGSVALALKLNGKELAKRSLRIERCTTKKKPDIKRQNFQAHQNFTPEKRWNKKKNSNRFPHQSQEINYQGEEAKKKAAWMFIKKEKFSNRGTSLKSKSKKNMKKNKQKPK